jgi:peroxiredoxin
MDGVPLAVLVVLLGLVVLSQLALWVVLGQVVQQQGRILLRLDHVVDAHTSPSEPVGLPVGTPIGDFQLPDLAGRSVSPDTWRGRRTLLIHWSTSCGFCDLIAPELAELESDLRTQQVRLVLASYGDAEANRRLAAEYGLSCSILLQPEGRPLAAFSQLGTPVAYVLDETGRVAEPLAHGADPVVAVARRLAARSDGRRKHLAGERPLSESRIERDGLKAGSVAPPFRLPDIYGDTVSLESYRGRRVLLVFTDPHCGPCEALAPDLARLARQGRDGGLSVVAIARGAAEDNARDAELYEFIFPVALQKRWEVSKGYGIFATPVGFLIDEQGVIVRDVAVGPDAIVALAEEGLSAGTRKELGNGRAVR